MTTFEIKAQEEVTVYYSYEADTPEEAMEWFLSGADAIGQPTYTDNVLQEAEVVGTEIRR